MGNSLPTSAEPPNPAHSTDAHRPPELPDSNRNEHVSLCRRHRSCSTDENHDFTYRPRAGLRFLGLDADRVSVLEAHVSFGNQAPLGTALLATALACFVLDASHAKQATGPTPDPTPAYPGDASRGREIPAAQTRTPAIAPVSPESIEDRILAQLERRRARMGHPDLRSVAKTIVEEAQRHAIDPALVLAIIQVESGCHRRAVSRVGARGLMQVMPSTAAAIAKKMSLEWKGEDSLFDPQVNIKLGVAYLGELQRRYQDIRKALIAYNWGPTRVDRMLRRGKALPRTYVEIVWSTYESGRDSEVGRS